MDQEWDLDWSLTIKNGLFYYVKKLLCHPVLTLETKVAH